MRQIFPENLSCSRRRRSGTARTRHPPVAFHRGGRTRRELHGSHAGLDERAPHAPPLRPQRAGSERAPGSGSGDQRRGERANGWCGRCRGRLAVKPRARKAPAARAPRWPGRGTTPRRAHDFTPAPCFSPRFFCLVARITTGHRSDRELTNLCSRFFYFWFRRSIRFADHDGRMPYDGGY